MKTRQMVVSLSVVLMLGALLSANFQKQAAPAAGMAEAANAFVATLTDAQRAKASFEFNDAERLNWHYIPRERKGLPIRELEGDALKTGLTLLRSGLSEVGYDQALNVMSLEELLYLLEGGTREERRDKRDPKKYYISIFGKPGSKGSWAWRVEGHHLSLNYTIVDGELVSTTPEFFGANPGFVDAGPGREIRVLGPEEDIARQILKQCSPDQVKKCWLSEEAPNDIRSTGTQQPDTSAPVGLPIKEMSADQKKLMADLLAEYLQNMPVDVAAERRQQINAAGKDDIYFAWWGDSERNARHHYRVQGPTFLIEYNNTQNSANHVHAIWRNMDGDFNLPAK
ncbi:MAG: DUF3500 domain-containing protein [Planctomycetota bacterium]|nr:DUF3500 domain-containing protein [Planctomycetota bacterium]